MLLRGKFSENDLNSVFNVVLILMIANILNGFAIILSNHLYSKGESNFLSILGLIQYSIMLILVIGIHGIQTPTGIATLLLIGGTLSTFAKVFIGARKLSIENYRLIKYSLYKALSTSLFAVVLWKLNMENFYRITLCLTIIVFLFLSNRPYASSHIRRELARVLIE
jgi:hypothetical protein